MRAVAGRVRIDDVEAFLAELDAIAAETGAAVQAFDGRYVAGPDHLAAAVERANRARERGDAIADDHGVEILLYAASRRQIDQAIEMGVSPGEGPVVVVVDGGTEAAAESAVSRVIDPEGDPGDARDEALLCDFFGITEVERRATDASLEALVAERVALLAVEK